MAKIRTEILIESNESLIVKRKRYSIRTWCGECRRISIMVLPTEAAFLSGQDINLIISLMFANSLHVRYLNEGKSFVCLTSLCLFPFENAFENLNEESEHEVLEINNYSFINEEFLKNET